MIANGKLYAMGYLGEGADLQEGVACFDAETGKKLWQHLYNDFLSDTIYLRYATASPAIDRETGNVYMQGTQGILAAFTPDGKLLWQHSLMEKFGRLTFPNSRTASPVIDGDLVITRGITANWGAQGPGADRFYAFDKKTGELVWASSPGGTAQGQFLFASAAWLVSGPARVLRRARATAAWCASTRAPASRSGACRCSGPGINATVLVHQRRQSHRHLRHALRAGPDGRAQDARRRCRPTPPPDRWCSNARSSNSGPHDISSSTSSPILVGDTIYVVAEKGDLFAVDANTGAIKWKLKLGIEQRNSCPLFADGKLYVPMLDDPATKATGEAEAGTKGAFYIIKPGEKEGEMLCHVALEAAASARPWPTTASSTCKPRATFIAGASKGDNPGLPARRRRKSRGPRRARRRSSR